MNKTSDEQEKVQDTSEVDMLSRIFDDLREGIAQIVQGSAIILGLSYAVGFVTLGVPLRRFFGHVELSATQYLAQGAEELIGLSLVCFIVIVAWVLGEASHVQSRFEWFVRKRLLSGQLNPRLPRVWRVFGKRWLILCLLVALTALMAFGSHVPILRAIARAFGKDIVIAATVWMCLMVGRRGQRKDGLESGQSSHDVTDTLVAVASEYELEDLEDLNKNLAALMEAARKIERIIVSGIMRVKRVVFVVAVGAILMTALILATKYIAPPEFPVVRVSLSTGTEINAHLVSRSNGVYYIFEDGIIPAAIPEALVEWVTFEGHSVPEAFFLQDR